MQDTSCEKWVASQCSVKKLMGGIHMMGERRQLVQRLQFEKQYRGSKGTERRKTGERNFLRDALPFG
jgi:hypothetical protein